MKFPHDYPYSPPSIRFITKVWHPNVYENGDLCISILHPPVDDPQSGELPCERWNPTQNVRTILLSVISLLNEPNTFSPANVDASVMYRRWRDSNGRDNEYPNIIRWLAWIDLARSQFDYITVQSTNWFRFRKQALLAKTEAEKEGIVVPLTLEEYCLKPKANPNNQEPQVSVLIRRDASRRQSVWLLVNQVVIRWVELHLWHRHEMGAVVSRDGQ